MTMHDIPHDENVEAAILGAAIHDEKSLMQAIDLLRPDDFYHPQHRIIFDVIHDVALNGHGALDCVTLTSYLRDRGLIDRVGGATFVSDLMDAAETFDAVPRHAAIVKKHSQRRRLLKATQNATAAIAGGRSLQGVQADLLAALISLERPKAATGGDLATLTQNAARKALDIQAGDVASMGVLTGVNSLDELLQGLKRSALYLLAARPRIGKSAMVDQIAVHVAEAGNRPVFLLITEMSPQQRAARRLSVLTRIPLPRINMGTITPQERESVQAVADGRQRAPANVYVESAAGLTAGEVRLAVKRLAARHGEPALIAVDYIQQLRAANPRASMVERTGEKSRVLCDLAVEMDCPTIVCSQLSRACETERREPRLSDLRESGDLEQDAFGVMFLHRPNMEDQKKVVFILAKHRDGPEGVAPLRFRPEVFRFEGYGATP